jgi:hypothetical protein
MPFERWEKNYFDDGPLAFQDQANVKRAHFNIGELSIITNVDERTLYK